MVEILRNTSAHKYPGRVFKGNLRERGQCNLMHRISCGWLKFHEYGGTLLNQKIPSHLRLRLFDTVVSPTVLYSLSSTPLTSAQLGFLDTTQRKMLRRIVGWVRFADEDWELTGRRMKMRLENALQQYPVTTWSQARMSRRSHSLRRLTSRTAPLIACLVHEWHPPSTNNGCIPYRRQGRPYTRWCD